MGNAFAHNGVDVPGRYVMCMSSAMALLRVGKWALGKMGNKGTQGDMAFLRKGRRCKSVTVLCDSPASRRCLFFATARCPHPSWEAGKSHSPYIASASSGPAIRRRIGLDHTQLELSAARWTRRCIRVANGPVARRPAELREPPLSRRGSDSIHNSWLL